MFDRSRHRQQLRPRYGLEHARVVPVQDRHLVDARTLVAHAPVGLELLVHRGLREDCVARELADPTSSAPDGAQLHGRDAAAVAADRARLAAAVRLGELAGRRKVEPGEGVRFAEGVTADYCQ